MNDLGCDAYMRKGVNGPVWYSGWRAMLMVLFNSPWLFRASFFFFFEVDTNIGHAIFLLYVLLKF